MDGKKWNSRRQRSGAAGASVFWLGLGLVACSADVLPPVPEGAADDMVVSGEAPAAAESNASAAAESMANQESQANSLPMPATPSEPAVADDTAAMPEVEEEKPPPALSLPGSNESEASADPAAEAVDEPSNLQTAVDPASSPSAEEPAPEPVDEPSPPAEMVVPESSATTPVEPAPVDPAPVDEGTGSMDPPAGPLPPEVVDGNLVQNSSLEDGLSGWGVWGGQLAVTQAFVHSGAFAGVVTERTETWQGGVQDVLASVQTGVTYQARAFATVSGDAAADVILTLKVTCDGTDDYINIVAARATPGTWTELSGSVTLPSCTLEAADLYVEGPPAGIDLYFDDVSLAP